MFRRLLPRSLMATLALLLIAAPAHADAPGPTNYQSEILGLSPATDAIDVRVIGGDSFLELVSHDAEVLVPGYDGDELYLRFDPSGEVYVNRNAATYYQNESRYGVSNAEIPPGAGPEAAPDWELVASGGSYAWHDHRIHWMSPTTLPGQVDPTRDERQVAYEWPEPIVLRVDGQPVAVAGRLVWLPDASPVPAMVLGTVLLLAVVVGALRRPEAASFQAVGVGAVAAAVVVGVPSVAGLPAGVPAQPLLLVLPLLGLVVAVAGWSIRDRSPFAVLAIGAGAVPLLIWAVSQIGALTAPIVPPEAAGDLMVRLTVGSVLGLATGAVVAAIRGLLVAEPILAEA